MGNIILKVEDGIATITLSNPKRKNAMDQSMWISLRDLCTSISNDATVRTIVITGQGNDFCSGADLSDPDSLTLDGLSRMRMIGDSILAVHRLNKPTFAVVKGVCVGAGMGLALACDIVYAENSARFCEIFSKRGLAIDGGSSWLLPRLVGPQKAKEIAFFGEMISATEGFNMGFVNRVLESDEIDEFVQTRVAAAAKLPTVAVSLTKTLINHSFEASFESALEDEARSQSLVFTTKDFATAIKAFMEKSEPKFEGC
jgi:2-(1,2-epoxy-1,2-dihydrophenyl)acetyl-CoA isomerase